MVAYSDDDRVSADEGGEWYSFIKNNPVLYGRPGDRETEGFCVHLRNINNVELTELIECKVQIRFGIFNTDQRTFVGRTWKGPFKTIKPVPNKPINVDYNECVYFHTSLQGPRIVLVFEIVIQQPVSTTSGTPRSRGAGGGVLGTQRSIGWGFTRLYSTSTQHTDISHNDNPTVDKTDMFHGTPRALLFMNEPLESSAFLKPITSCNVSFSLQTHEKFDKISHLLPVNVPVSKHDRVAGVGAPSKSGVDPLHYAHTQPTVTMYIDKLTIVFDKGVENFDTELCRDLANDYRQRMDELNESDKTHVTVTGRSLQIGVHNGWHYTSEPQVYETQLTDSEQTTSTKNLTVNKRMNISGVVEENPMCCVVFSILYTFNVTTDKHTQPSGNKSATPVTTQQTHTESHTIRWGCWLPCNSDKMSSATVMLHSGRQTNPMSVFVYRQLEGATRGNKHTNIIKFNYTKKPQSHQETETITSPRSPLPEPVEEAVIQEEVITQQTVEQLPQLQHEMTYESELEPISPRYQSRRGNDPILLPTIKSTAEYPIEVRHQEASSHTVEMNELPYTPVHAPILAMGSNISGPKMSRAAYSRLYSSGFKLILDRHGNPPITVDPGDPKSFDIQLEDSDILQCNEIVFQFLAYSQVHGVGDSISTVDSHNKTMYFTFQFYRYPHVTSERVMLNTNHGTDIDPSPTVVLPQVLNRLNIDGTSVCDSPGLMYKYFVDPLYMKCGEVRLFSKYLSNHILHIDVWDGDSLLLVGSCAVELKHLTRQGRESVQITHELDVITTEYSEDSPALIGDLTHGGSVRHVGVRSLLKGRLHLRMANIGYPLDTKSINSGSIPLKSSKTIIIERPGTGFLGGSLKSTARTRIDWRGHKASRALHMAEADRDLCKTITALHNTDVTTDSITLSNTNNNTSSNREGDTERAEKIRRMKKLRQTIGPDSVMSDDLKLKKQEKVQRIRELRMIEDYRRDNKKDDIVNMLQLSITTEHTIYPMFATAEFFEFEIHNPFNVQTMIRIEIHDVDLQVITDSQCWRYFKSITETHTPMEDDMIDIDSDTKHPQFYLKSKERVHIPFKYQTFKSDNTAPPQGPGDLLHTNHVFRPGFMHTTGAIVDSSLQSKVIKVFFKTTDNRPIAILALSIEPQPPVIDQSFRFHHPEQSFLKKCIRLPPWKSVSVHSDRLTVRCSDPNVIAETKGLVEGEPQDVLIKAATGSSPSLQKFYACVYTDVYISKPIQCWQFYIHSLQRVDVNCVEGQTTWFSIILRGTQASRLVRVFYSNINEMAIQPNDSFMLIANTVHEVHVGVRPLTTGNKFMYINVVDIEYHQLIRSWLVCVNCRLPLISRAFEISLPVGGGKGSNKKLSYSNPYPHRKLYRFRSNRDDLVQFRELEAEIGANEVYSIGLRFAPSTSPGATEIMIFINDSTDKNEETYCVKAVYTYNVQ